MRPPASLWNPGVERRVVNASGDAEPAKSIPQSGTLLPVMKPGVVVAAWGAGNGSRVRAGMVTVRLDEERHRGCLPVRFGGRRSRARRS